MGDFIAPDDSGRLGRSLLHFQLGEDRIVSTLVTRQDSDFDLSR